MHSSFLGPLILASFAAINFPIQVAANDSTVPSSGFSSSRYESLWSKSPFAVASNDAPPSDTSDYSLVGIAQFDGISYVNLVNKQTQEHFLLSTTQEKHGLILISITAREAVLRQDNQTITLRLESTLPLPPTLPVFSAALPVPSVPCPPVPPDGTLPISFRAIDPTSVKLSTEQKVMIDKLRQDFIDEMGPYPNPTDPAYGKRWKQAQSSTDDAMRALLGKETFTDYQLGAMQQASRSQTNGN